MKTRVSLRYFVSYCKLKDLILDGKTYVPNNLLELQTFRNIFPQITALNNGTSLKNIKLG